MAGMKTVTAVSLGSQFGANTPSSSVTYCSLMESPMSGSALQGNQITGSAIIKRQANAYRNINGIQGFSIGNENAAGNFEVEWAKNNFNNFIVNGCGADLTSPYLYSPSPSNTDASDSIKKQWQIYSTRTDSYTDTLNNESYTGTSWVSNNFPYVSGYPTSVAPLTGTSSNWANYINYTQPRPCSGYPYFSTIASDTSCEMQLTSTTFGVSGSTVNVVAKITSTLSGLIDPSPFYDQLKTDFFSHNFSASFNANNQNQFSVDYRTFVCSYGANIGGINPATYPDTVRLNNFLSILNSYYNSNVVNADAYAGWTISNGAACGTLVLNRGQVKYTGSLNSPQITYFVGSVECGIAGNYAIWWDEALDSNKQSINYLAQPVTSSVFLKQIQIVNMDMVSVNQTIGWDSGCDIDLRAQGWFPEDNPFPLQTRNNTVVYSKQYFIVVGKDPSMWLKENGYTLKEVDT